MPPFTPTQDQRIAISRRLVKLPQEIIIYGLTSDNAAGAASNFEQTNLSNEEMLDYWINAIVPYSNEREELSGIVTDDFIMTDIQGIPPAQKGLPPYPNTNDPANPGDPRAKFFQWQSSPVPGVDNFGTNPAVNSYGAGVRSSWRAGWCEEWIAKSYRELINSLVYGWGGGGGNVTTAYGNIAGTTLTVGDTTAITAGQVLLVIGTSGAPPVAHQHLYYVVEVIDATTLEVRSLGGGVVTTGTVYIKMADNTPYNNDFPSGTYLDAETAITTFMEAVVDWTASMDLQHTILGTNTDETYQIINAIAYTNTDITTAPIVTALNLWNGLVSPDPKFRNAALLTLLTAVTIRIAQIDTRITQFGAIGNGVIQGTYEVLYEGPFADRYIWLDKVLNKGYGTRAQEENMRITKAVIDQQKNAAIVERNGYRTVMSATVLEDEPDGTKSIIINTSYFDGPSYYSPFVAGDKVWVVDEMNSEIPADPAGGTIKYIYDDGRVDLDFEVPVSYTTDGLVRLYKVL